MDAVSGVEGLWSFSIWERIHRGPWRGPTNSCPTRNRFPCFFGTWHRSFLQLAWRLGGTWSTVFLHACCWETSNRPDKEVDHVPFKGSGSFFGLGCGSKFNRRGKPRVLVHVSTYQGSTLVFRVFEAPTATWYPKACWEMSKNFSKDFLVARSGPRRIL